MEEMNNKQLFDIAAKVIKEHGGELEIMEVDEDKDMWIPRVSEQPDGLVDLSIYVESDYQGLKLGAEYWQEFIPHEDMKGLIEELHLVKEIFDKIVEMVKNE